MWVAEACLSWSKAVVTPNYWTQIAFISLDFRFSFIWHLPDMVSPCSSPAKTLTHHSLVADSEAAAETNAWLKAEWADSRCNRSVRRFQKAPAGLGQERSRAVRTDAAVVLNVAGCSFWLRASLRPPHEGTQGDLQITELQDGYAPTHFPTRTLGLRGVLRFNLFVCLF